MIEERRPPKALGATAARDLTTVYARTRAWGDRTAAYDGELASNILLDDGDSAPADIPNSTHLKQPFYSCDGGPQGIRGPPFSGTDTGHASRGGNSSSARHYARHIAPPHRRADGDAPNRTPTRTPSPEYHWNHPKDEPRRVCGQTLDNRLQEDRLRSADCMPAETWTGGDGQQAGIDEAAETEAWPSSLRSIPPCKNSSSTSTVSGDQASQLFQPQVPLRFLPPPYWPSGFNPQAYYGMMMNNPLGAQADGKGVEGMDPNLWQMMVAMQVMGQASHSSASSASPPPQVGADASTDDTDDLQAHKPAWDDLRAHKPAWDAGVSSAPARKDGVGGSGSGSAGGVADGWRAKSRNKDKDAPGMRSAPEAAAPPANTNLPRERGPGSKGERRRRGMPGQRGEGAEERPARAAGGGKSKGMDLRPQSSHPILEQLKARDRNIALGDLAAHISEIALDQYGSRLIQQKLEMASEQEKQVAFKSVLQKMPQLTTDVFGNYVIQKFFEHGSSEQRRILAEQLVGQVLGLSLQMYGCRVVQKALDSVAIEQQVLLIGELKGHVQKCIEDQHGNHVIQKCIERLPTDRIGFIVESFVGQTSRTAKHFYGCRVIQRLIEYCHSVQIFQLLEEVLHCSTELATDQYGNYVVQHVMEHSSRAGDRQAIMHMVRENILPLSCHKYASNVIEKALACGTLEERALLINAIIGERGDMHPPLLTMMRDRFGNYIVQRVIALAQGPQREALLVKLHAHMPALKKSNTYGKHIISALQHIPDWEAPWIQPRV